MQSECVRCRGELMSLGVDDRSPSAADASEMMDGCLEWQGLTRTAVRQWGDGGSAVAKLGCRAAPQRERKPHANARSCAGSQQYPGRNLNPYAKPCSAKPKSTQVILLKSTATPRAKPEPLCKTSVQDLSLCKTSVCSKTQQFPNPLCKT